MTVTNHRITVMDSDSEFVCSEENTLLVGMEQQLSKALSVGCRGGGCGVCKIRILSGTYLSKRMSRAHISEQDEQEGVVLACRVFPRSNLVVIGETNELIDKSKNKN